MCIYIYLIFTYDSMPHECPNLLVNHASSALPPRALQRLPGSPLKREAAEIQGPYFLEAGSGDDTTHIYIYMYLCVCVLGSNDI